MRTLTSSEVACYRLIRDFRRKEIAKEWGGGYIGRVVAVATTAFEKIPNPPEQKNLAALWAAFYSSQIPHQRVTPEFITGLIELLYGASVAKTIPVERMMEILRDRQIDSKARFFESGIHVRLVPVTYKLLGNLTSTLPEYE